MLDFRNVPALPPQYPAVPFVVGSLDDVEDVIKAAWGPWFAALLALAPVAQITVNTFAVAAAMAADDWTGAMPIIECRRYCRLYLREVGPQASLAAKPWVGSLPSHHRRTADELLAVALSLATALNQGYDLFASSRAMNALLPRIPLWKRVWPGNGPDYVLAVKDPATGKISMAFIEIKGQATDCKKTPKEFAKYKAQSLNADILGIQNRYLLSYAYVPAQGGGAGAAWIKANVQWFNATTPPAPGAHRASPQIQQFVLLGIALCQFQAQLRNAGHDVRILDRNADAYALGFENVDRHWIERGPRSAPRLLIADQARRCFRQIAALIDELRNDREVDELDNLDAALAGKDLTRLVRRLTDLREAVANELDGVLHGYETHYRYATGIHIVSNRR